MYYQEDRVIEEFYKNLLDGNEDRVHIPRSDVFYVREAIRAQTGVRYGLDHVERAMYLEGHLQASDVFEPNRERPGIDYAVAEETPHTQEETTSD